jgi:hypothetical protein
MIKAEDIRIGDIVRVCRNGWFPEGTVCLVTQINSERSYKENKGAITLSYVDGTDDGPWGVWCSHIEGIPLTPAILEKNGFNIKESEESPKSYIKDIDSSSRYLGRYLDIEYKRGEWGVFLRVKLLPDTVLVRQIRYVHELQHILWAMGIDAGFEI